jgi:Putative Ig domain
VTINAVDDAPVLEGDSSTQTVQYSDLIASVKFSASDRDDAAGDLALTTSALPSGLAFVDNGDGTGTLSGAAGVKEGTYPITVTATDPGGQTASATFTLVVVPEKASIQFAATDPAAVKVAAAGGNSGPVTLTVLVSETEPDAPSGSAAAGDINRAQTTVELVPVGPGTTVAGSCTPVPVSPVTGYADELTVKCSFSSLPVNTYTVSAKVAGAWYVGSAENVFTVYDPGLGFTTGGGWFYWPGTTDRTNFGYVMKYTSKLTSLKGSLLVIRHRPDGSIYRVKSNALSTLSVGEDRSIPMGGRASPARRPTWSRAGWTRWATTPSRSTWRTAMSRGPASTASGSRSTTASLR